MKLRIKLKTSPSIGGYSSEVFIDKVSARNSLGIPIIPASAIKGALRIEFERLLRSVAIPRICDSSTPETMCRNEDNLCLACKLFGGIYNQAKLRFSDAVIEDEKWEEFFREKKGYTTRAGIGISRKVGTIKENMLFDKKIIEPFIESIEFCVAIEHAESLTSEEEKYLKCAVRSLGAIGGEKARGLGWIEASIEDDNPSSQTSNKLNFNSNTLLVKLVPKEPIRINFTKTSAYFYETLGYIPGSTIRGAIAKYIGNKYGYRDNKFIQFFLKQPVIFCNLYPSGRDIRSRGMAKPIPLSARTCKTYLGFEVYMPDECPEEEKRHGSKDILIMSFLTKLISEEIGISLPLKEKCDHCEGSLKNLSGFYIIYSSEIKAPPRQVMTRIAINRKLSTTREGALYSYEAIEPIFNPYTKRREPLIFSGLMKIPENSNGVKGILSEIKEIQVGGRKNVGFGKAEIQFEDYIGDSKETLRKRLIELNQKIGKLGKELTGLLGLSSSKLEERFRKLVEGNLSEVGGIYFTITLTSDLIFPEPDFNSFIERQFGSGVELKECFLDTHRVGGWNTAVNIQKELYTAVSMGSTLIFSILSNEIENLIDKVSELNQRGIGLQTFEGFGQFSFCDEFHYKKIFQI
jgi:CRISPR-associated protein Csx10